MDHAPALEEISSSLPPLCSPQQVCLATGIPVATLAFWRVEGRNMPFVKLGRIVRYRREDVISYLAAHVFTSTAEAKANAIDEDREEA